MSYDTLKLIRRISLFGIFILTIKIFFFENYFSEKFNKVTLYVLIVLFIIFPLIKILEKKAKERYENK
jgi:hypothetical protein